MEIAKGKWTYATAALMLVFGLVGLVTGWLEPDQGMGLILNASGLFGLRRAVK